MGVMPICFAGSAAAAHATPDGRAAYGPGPEAVQFAAVHNTVSPVLPTSPTARGTGHDNFLIAPVHGQDIRSANLRGQVHPAGWPYGVRAPVRAAVVGYVDPARVATRTPVRPGVALMSDDIGIFA